MRKAAVLFFLMFLLVGCAPAEATAVPTLIAAPSQKVFEFRVPDVLPTPSTGKGSVFGTMVTDDIIDLRGFIVYLGGLAVVSDGQYAGILDEDRAPFTYIDTMNGKFFINDVDPGQYSLILYDIGFGGRAYMDESGSVYVIEVVANQQTNLDEIFIDLSE